MFLLYKNDEDRVVKFRTDYVKVESLLSHDNLKRNPPRPSPNL